MNSISSAHLDINETTLIFEYPGTYYLDLNLKYKVDKDKGKAKFDKTKKTLVVRVPVIGLTEDSQRVYEENMKRFKEQIEKKK